MYVKTYIHVYVCYGRRGGGILRGKCDVIKCIFSFLFLYFNPSKLILYRRAFLESYPLPFSCRICYVIIILIINNNYVGTIDNCNIANKIHFLMDVMKKKIVRFSLHLAHCQSSATSVQSLRLCKRTHLHEILYDTIDLSRNACDEDDTVCMCVWCARAHIHPHTYSMIPSLVPHGTHYAQKSSANACARARAFCYRPDIDLSRFRRSIPAAIAKRDSPVLRQTLLSRDIHT